MGKMLHSFDYIIWPDPLTPENLLLSNGRPKTLAHVQAVAEECVRIGKRFGLTEETCRLAGMLHDISAVIRPQDMLAWAEAHAMPLCEAERRYPFLLHQRMSRLVAQTAFQVTDDAVLSAVECHTTLKANASILDMTLFIADKIAWDQPGEPPYLHDVLSALETSLEAACLCYMKVIEQSGKLLYPHACWTEAVQWLTKENPT